MIGTHRTISFSDKLLAIGLRQKGTMSSIGALEAVTVAMMR